jgi:hypothetical protein
MADAQQQSQKPPSSSQPLPSQQQQQQQLGYEQLGELNTLCLKLQVRLLGRS